MHTILLRSAPTALLVATLLAPATGAQVDPEWLRMWTEAQTHRPADLDSTGRIAPEGEPGTPLVIHGRVVAPDGRTPVPGVTVFAYQTDEAGVYFGPDKPGRPWRLQGWVVTDATGRFELRTIRPGAYPGRRIPAHVHLSVETPEHGRQWTEELRFADDPMVTTQERRRAADRGRLGGVRPVRRVDGVHHVSFAIRLKPEGDF
ncbi:MAG: hypothetical protein ACRD2Z_18210 [Thermoanaerobaculia bacterium]